jgi:hypothetical protein
VFEKRHEKLLPRSKFLIRLVKFAFLSIGLIVVSLIIGIVGYHQFEGLSWIDAFLNSAMLMGGMGQIDVIHTDAGKVFAGIYAMYCGIIVLVSVALLLAPIFHRLLHHFHLEGDFPKK